MTSSPFRRVHAGIVFCSTILLLLIPGLAWAKGGKSPPLWTMELRILIGLLALVPAILFTYHTKWVKYAIPVLAGLYYVLFLWGPAPGMEDEPYLVSDYWKLFFLVAVLALLTYRGIRALRWGVMIFSLYFLGFLFGMCKSPVGAAEYLLIHEWSWDNNLRHVIKIAIVLGPALLLGKYFCGWICPKGVVQDLVHRRETSLTVPRWLDVPLKSLKYVFLALLIIYPFTSYMEKNVGLFMLIGPFRVIWNLEGTYIQVMFLVVVLVAAAVIGRPYCRYVCPLSAALSIMQTVSPFRFRGIGSTCIGCGQGDKVCPTDAINCKTVKRTNNLVVSRFECIGCGECTQICKRDSVYYGIFGRKGPEESIHKKLKNGHARDEASLRG